jgi:predicted transcriptional regulator
VKSREIKVGETKSLILDMVNKQPKTIKEIDFSLGFSKELIYTHI